MNLIRISALLFLGIGLSLVSCKRKYEEFIGPQVETNFSLVEPLKLSTKEVDFTDNDTNRVYFKAEINKPTDITVTIEGLESAAKRTLVFKKVSVLDSSLFWNGAQDILYYFRTGEKCVVTIKVGGNAANNEVTQQLKDRGELITEGTVLDTDTLIIRKRKAMPANQVELFPSYPSTAERNYQLNRIYVVGYDVEGSIKQIEKSEDLKTFTFGTSSTAEYLTDNTSLLTDDPNRKPIRGTNGDRFFILKGKDQVSKITPFNVPDYYIGRLMSPNMLKNVQSNFNGYGGGVAYNFITNLISGVAPDNLYFNVFVYGNGDGSQINYTVKELESTAGEYNDASDESYQYTIKVNFKGWQLFSIPYSKFAYTQQKKEKTGEYYDGSNANRVKEPGKIVNVQFSLVASKLGGEGQMIIDCPVMSWGGPLQY